MIHVNHFLYSEASGGHANMFVTFVMSAEGCEGDPE